MVDVTTTADTVAEESRSPSEIRRARALAIVYLVLAGISLVVFALGGSGEATFALSRPTDTFAVPDLVVPVATLGWLVTAVLSFLGARQWMRGFGSKTNLVLALGFILFVIAFLAWAASDASISIFGILQETMKRAVPITFGAVSGILCERTAVINIGIEGMLLGGAFTGALVGSLAGTVPALLAATAVGGLLSAGLAVLAVKYRVDQIIAGVVINIFVLGLTSFYTSQLLVHNPHLNNAAIMKPWSIPILSSIPVIGPALFNQNFFVYAMYVLVALTTYSLFRTRWGLRTRAVGEHPKAADTLGINVFKMRYLNVIIGGMVAGLGGAYFTLGSVGQFNENMTAGRGFIGLAAMIFGRWHPVGAFGAALVFGFADSLQIRLGILNTPIPSEFLAMAPYIVTIIVVAGLVGHARPPAADGQPYIKE